MKQQIKTSSSCENITKPLVEHNENYFLLMNLSKEIITINEPFAQLLKIDIHYANSKPPKNIINYLPEIHLQLFINMFEIIKTGKSAQYELMTKNEAGDEKWIRFDFSPFYNLKNKLKGITCIGINISKEKVQEKKIVNQKQLLDEITNTYCHKLRHPLTNILAIINIMKYDNVTTNMTYFKYLEIASKQLDAVIHHVVRQTYMVA